MTASSERGAMPIPRARPRRLLLRATLGVFSLTVILGLAAWFAREPLLRSAADLWIVSDQAVTADAVAIFGGGLESRPFAAAEYYKQGIVKKILVAGIGSSRAERLGVLQSHVDNNRRILLMLGVPETAIETFGSGLSNSYEEALALRGWATRAGARSIIVPTEIFAARRLRWMLHRVFADDVTIRVPALDPLDYRRDNWWRNEAGLIGFQNEVIKYAYYRFKY
jgi:uncharacterized SAM-binding protein YcdF (DUF218 family)